MREPLIREEYLSLSEAERSALCDEAPSREEGRASEDGDQPDTGVSVKGGERVSD
jgi:hypothetical protein